MSRGAFTLLETLLAISLTVSVGIAALSLTTWQARLGASARNQERGLTQIVETLRLLDEDLLLSVKHPEHGRFQVEEDGTLRLSTACRLPGEPPGPHEVVWQFAAETGTVVRRSTHPGDGATTTHAVGRDWTQFAIEPDQDRLWLTARIDSSAELWRLPLWTEDP